VEEIECQQRAIAQKEEQEGRWEEQEGRWEEQERLSREKQLRVWQDLEFKQRVCEAQVLQGLEQKRVREAYANVC
jgi:hypothetical protein